MEAAHVQADSSPRPSPCWAWKSSGSPLPASNRPLEKTFNLKKPVDSFASFCSNSLSSNKTRNRTMRTLLTIPHRLNKLFVLVAALVLAVSAQAQNFTTNGVLQYNIWEPNHAKNNNLAS